MLKLVLLIARFRNAFIDELKKGKQSDIKKDIVLTKQTAFVLRAVSIEFKRLRELSLEWLTLGVHHLVDAY